MALGHRAQRLAGPQRGARGGGRLEPVTEADGPRELDRLRPPGQHRFGAEVDGDARDLARAQLAAEAVRRLQDRYPHAAFEQPVRGRQPRDAATDDDDMADTGGRPAPTALHCAHADTPPVSGRGTPTLRSAPHSRGAHLFVTRSLRSLMSQLSQSPLAPP